MSNMFAVARYGEAAPPCQTGSTAVAVTSDTQARTQSPVSSAPEAAPYPRSVAIGVIRMWRNGLRQRWRGAGGGREVLAFCYPLILSQITFTLQMFINRLLLTWYAPEAVAAATASLFIIQVGILVCASTGEYTTTFVAQYVGAGRPERIGSVMWQGIWFALFSGIVLAALVSKVGAIFTVAGRAARVRAAS